MIPPEVMPFLSAAGRLLLVKGTAGTGKTLLAMEVARAYQARGGDVLWISSRHADPTEAIDLEELVPESNLRNAVPSTTTSSDASPMARTTRGTESPEPPRGILEDIEGDLDQADTLVVVDSIDGLFPGGDARAGSDFTTRAKELAARTGARFLIVLEASGRHAIDHLVDGVILLDQTLTDGALARTFTLQKLRGTPLPNPVYLFTLAGGNFSALIEEPPEPVAKPLRAPGRTAKDGYLSTGITAWDVLLGGGLRHSSVHLLEIGARATRDAGRLTTPLLLNALATGHNVVWAAMPNAEREGPQHLVQRHLDSALRDRLAVLQSSDLRDSPSGNVQERLAPLERERRRFGRHVSILSIDSLGVANDALGRAWLSRWCQQTRENGSIDVLLVGEHEAETVASLVDGWWRLTRSHDVPLLRGVVPQTAHHFVRSRRHRGYPETLLEAVH